MPLKPCYKLVTPHDGKPLHVSALAVFVKHVAKIADQRFRHMAQVSFAIYPSDIEKGRRGDTLSACKKGLGF
jgi:hypothetical protein